MKSGEWLILKFKNGHWREEFRKFKIKREKRTKRFIFARKLKIRKWESGGIDCFRAGKLNIGKI